MATSGAGGTDVLQNLSLGSDLDKQMCAAITTATKPVFRISSRSAGPARATLPQACRGRLGEWVSFRKLDPKPPLPPPAPLLSQLRRYSCAMAPSIPQTQRTSHRRNGVSYTNCRRTRNTVGQIRSETPDWTTRTGLPGLSLPPRRGRLNLKVHNKWCDVAISPRTAQAASCKTRRQIYT